MQNYVPPKFQDFSSQEEKFVMFFLGLLQLLGWYIMLVYIQDRSGKGWRRDQAFAVDALPPSESVVGRFFRRPRCWAAGETPAPR